MFHLKLRICGLSISRNSLINFKKKKTESLNQLYSKLQVNSKVPNMTGLIQKKKEVCVSSKTCCFLGTRSKTVDSLQLSI